jgi:hypothetical protein
MQNEALRQLRPSATKWMQPNLPSLAFLTHGLDSMTTPVDTCSGAFHAASSTALNLAVC